MLRPRWIVWLAVGLATACSLTWLLRPSQISSGARLGLVALAVAAYALAVVVASRADRRTARTAVLAGAALLLTCAVVVPPRDSEDIWGYVSYARVLTEHGDNPYATAPAAHPDDPLLARMSEQYRGATTIYGPLFTTVSAAGTTAAGDRLLANRLFFQVLAAGTAAATLVLVDRRTRGDPAALAFLGLSPAVIAMVNGAHPDLLIGALLLGAVIVAGRKRAVATGLLIAAAVLVKIVAVVPAAAIVVWSARRLGARATIIIAAVGTGIVAASYTAVGGTAALQPVRDARLFGTRGQAWEIVRSRWSDALAADGVADAAELAHEDVARLAVPLVAILVLLALWRFTSRADAAAGVTGAGMGYLLAAPYVLPWYSGWVLPTAATTLRRTPLAALAGVQSMLVLVVYADPPGHLPEDGPLLDLSTRWLPVVGIALGVAFVVVAFLSRDEPTPVDAADEPVSVEPGVPGG